MAARSGAAGNLDIPADGDLGEEGTLGDPSAISTRCGYGCGVAALLLGLYQPLLGIW
jgi:hypothetical protein